VFAAVVLGAAITGAAWLASYRMVMLVASNRRSPDLPAPSFYPVNAPVWWGAWSAVILLAAGIVISERLLPERARVLRRSMERLLLDPLPDPLRPRALVREFARVVMKGGRLVLSGLDWFVADPVRLLVKRSS
jgi:hypothetical protein